MKNAPRLHARKSTLIIVPVLLSFGLQLSFATSSQAVPLGPISINQRTIITAPTAQAQPLGPITVNRTTVATAPVAQPQQEQQTSLSNTTTAVINLAGPLQMTSNGTVQAQGLTGATGAPVIWVQHSDEELSIDSDGWQIVPELKPAPNESMIRKLYRNSVIETELAVTLAAKEVGHLFISGAEINNCVRFTAHGTLDNGYDLTLISDAHTTNDIKWEEFDISAEKIIEEQNFSFSSLQLPNQMVSTVTTKEIAYE